MSEVKGMTNKQELAQLESIKAYAKEVLPESEGKEKLLQHLERLQEKLKE